MDIAVHNNPVIAALADCHLFKSVAWQTIQLLAKDAKRLSFDRGQIIFHTGESDLGLFLVKNGQVKLSILAVNGSERVIEVVSPGQTFGESALFSAMSNRLIAEMLAKGEVIEIQRETIKRVVISSPTLASSMLDHLGTKLCRFVGDLENCCLRSARQRVINYLLVLANEQQPIEGRHLSILLPASKGVTASLLDITPETFSRELNRLIGMGLIQVDRKTIKILNLSGMQQPDV